MSETVAPDFLKLTAQIVSAHISHNTLKAEALPALIQDVYRSLTTAGHVEAAPMAQAPAVPIKKSVFPDYLICLEDGKKMKMLKRHLKTSYNLTPDEYRVKWGLPAGYPMVAPAYAEVRSNLAKSFGLGRKAANEPTAAPQVRRGRRPKA